MSTALLPNPSPPTDPGPKKPTPFEHLRNLFVLAGFCAAGAALGRSDDLAAVVPSWLWWSVAASFVAVAIWLGAKLVLQLVDQVLALVRRLLVGPRLGQAAFPAALAIFMPLCVLGVTIVLAPFFPDVVQLPGL